MSKSENNKYLRYALRLAISCFIVVVLYETFSLKNGYWAAFTVIACVVPTAGQSLKRAKQRIIGTIGGMILGIAIAHTFGSNLLYLDLLIPIFIFLTLYLKAVSYTYYSIFITVIAVLFICLIEPGNWQIAIVRVEMTLIGAAMAVLATYCIFPNRVGHALPEQLSELQNSLKAYYRAMVNSFSETETTQSHQSHVQAFSNIQNAMNTLQEADIESWNKRDDPKQREHLQKFQMLEKTYALLLLLETDMPNALTHRALLNLQPQLQAILDDITPLFDHPKAKTANNILQAIDALATQVHTLRAAAAKDPKLPLGSFTEHIQLAETLRNLKTLTQELSSLQKMQTP